VRCVVRVVRRQLGGMKGFCWDSGLETVLPPSRCWSGIGGESAMLRTSRGVVRHISSLDLESHEARTPILGQRSLSSGFPSSPGRRLDCGSPSVR
jgi:hypothetical protein